MCRFINRGRLICRPINVEKPLPPVPLTSTEAKVTIVDFTAQVCLIQTYRNVESDPIEATFEFPLDKNFTISSFAAIVEGKRIEGTCKEKEKAKDTYDDAIASGHGAYLMEQSKEDPDVFTVSVGNLPPGKEATIEISYVTELNFRDDMLIFGITNSKVKREEDSPYRRPSSSSIPPVKSSLSVQLEMTSNIKSISSQTHPITFEFGDKPSHATVTLSNPTPDDKDFELAVKLAEPHKPCGAVQVDSAGRKCAMVALYPALELGEDDKIYTEMIFVIDRSGSMSGSRINQVRDCLQVFLRSLPEGTLFNIVGFGSSHEFLFKKGSEEYNDDSLKKASAYVSALSANMGGTEILPPLQAIFNEKPKEGIPRQVFILTDGEVSNTQQCIECVRKNAETTRVFTFGIGAGASKELVKGIAVAGEGDFEMIIEGESMDHKVMRQLKRALQPAFTDLSVDWGNLKSHVTPAPYRLPLLFAGSRLVIYGFLSDKAEAGQVTIHAKTAVKPIKITLNLDPQNAMKGDQFHKLAAKKLISDLELSRSFMHDAQGELIKGKTSSDVKNESVKVSTTYGVLSTYTAFVAVEKREDATEGEMKLRKIKVEKAVVEPQPPALSLSTQFYAPPPPGASLHQNVHVLQNQRSAMPQSSSSAQKKSFSFGFFGGSGSAPAPQRDKEQMKKKKSVSSSRKKERSDMAESPMASSMAPPARSSEKESIASPMLYADDDMEEEVQSAPVMERRSSSSSSPLPPPAPKPAPAPSFAPPPSSGPAAPRPAPTSMRDLIMNQKANGSWAVQAIGSISVDAIKNSYPKSVSTTNFDLWMTAIVIAYLSTQFADQKVNWDLVVDKAKKWIKKEEKNLGGNPPDWEVEAKAFLSANGITV
eukprot:TRINITY_DN940_c0_g1_i3.p1 TRINITY_DN940_c0_g1~~TRINITY_DN940_c0_g1_i3.p1  ORF type:complete len:876 (-),score=276.34 TRINITY_DN940_c0_g1_i3:53-2680(-)